MSTPVEALQAEIDATDEKDQPAYFALLELAKVDAEFEAHKPTKPSYATAARAMHQLWQDEYQRLFTALSSARTKLYEVLQK